MEELEKAAQAIAAGNHREAHLLLARVIKSHPDNVDAWLMLSQVPTETQFAGSALIMAGVICVRADER